LVMIKKGDLELPGLTDDLKPQRLGPKRASKIRKLFNLSKTDDVRKYVIRRELPPKKVKEGAEVKETKAGTKPRTKAPKIQRLVTPITLQRKRRRTALRKQTIERHKLEAADYAKLLAVRNKEKRQALVSRKRTTSKNSVKVSGKLSTKEIKEEGKKLVGKKEAKTALKAETSKKSKEAGKGKGKKEAGKKAEKTTPAPAAGKTAGKAAVKVAGKAAVKVGKAPVKVAGKSAEKLAGKAPVKVATVKAAGKSGKTAGKAVAGKANPIAGKKAGKAAPKK